MTDQEKSIVSTIIYYHLLNRPLSSIELFKFLRRQSDSSFKFSDLFKELKKNKNLQSLIKEYRGFYFFREADTDFLFTLRQKRNKICQLKWKKVKKIAKVLQVIPFLEMIGVTGSLSLDNSRKESDFDFLIILKEGRLWLGRTLITFLLALLGWRRNQQKTRDRVCLNCYLADPTLAIKPFIKPHNFHSAQEYARLILVWQTGKDVFAGFQKANSWINEFIANYPWPAQNNLKRAAPIYVFYLIRNFLQWLFSGTLGDFLERKLAGWQIKRIKSKTSKNSPADQIYFSNQCLMFHPQSKSLGLLARHDALMQQLVKAA